MNAFECWKCGLGQSGETLPVSRLAECPACGAQLHVCRACQFHARDAANACREPVADPVSDKERANFCGYFQPAADAWRRHGRESNGGPSPELMALFGDAPPQAGDSKGAGRDIEDSLDELERLFGFDPGDKSGAS